MSKYETILVEIHEQNKTGVILLNRPTAQVSFSVLAFATTPSPTLLTVFFTT